MTSVFLRSDYEPDTQGEENTVCKCVRIGLDVCQLVLQLVELFGKGLGRAVPLGAESEASKAHAIPSFLFLGVVSQDVSSRPQALVSCLPSVMLPATMVVGCHPLKL